jgi:hypothetical protein
VVRAQKRAAERAQKSWDFSLNLIQFSYGLDADASTARPFFLSVPSKVSFLGVESLLPFCAWIFQGCKKCTIESKKIRAKLFYHFFPRNPLFLPLKLWGKKEENRVTVGKKVENSLSQVFFGPNSK